MPIGIYDRKPRGPYKTQQERDRSHALHVAAGRLGGLSKSGRQARYDALPPSVPGYIQRARILEGMNEDFCGGCGREGLCEAVEQTIDRQCPHVMWLCGECRAMPGLHPGEKLWH